MLEEYQVKKFDIPTNNNAVIHGVIYIEKPSFNYTEILASKNKVEEVKKLKLLRNKICQSLRINKFDMIIDETKYRLLTSRKIVVKYQIEIKELNLIPAIAEETKDKVPLEIEVEYLWFS